jgi:hypothetical protein
MVFISQAKEKNIAAKKSDQHALFTCSKKLYNSNKIDQHALFWWGGRLSHS